MSNWWAVWSQATKISSPPLLPPPPPLISLSPLFTGVQSYCPFSCLPKQQLPPASGPLHLLFPLPVPLFPSSLHGHSILISQILSQMSFLQKLSLTTLTNVPLLSFTQYIFLFYFLYLLTYYILLHIIKKHSTREKKYINISRENFNARSCMSCSS